jgi:phosphocarrier protein
MLPGYWQPACCASVQNRIKIHKNGFLTGAFSKHRILEAAQQKTVKTCIYGRMPGGRMKEIKYTLKDPLGLHARPAGQLVKAAAKYKCDIQIGTAVKMANAKRIIGVMALTLKQNDEVIMTFNGEDEEEAALACENFLRENV